MERVRRKKKIKVDHVSTRFCRSKELFDEYELGNEQCVRTWFTSAPASNKVCLRSNVWRGAHAVGFGRHFAWIYVGYGFDDSKPYTPLPPATPQAEFDFGEEGVAKECDDVLEDPDAGKEDEEGEGEDGGDE